MTTDVENNFDRICPLRTLEMMFQSIKILKFSGGACPPDPPSGWPLQRSPDLIKKKTPRFFILKKLDSLSAST